MEHDESGDICAIDESTYCHANKIQADAERIEADTSDKMEDDGNEQPQASPRRVEEGSAADFNHTTSSPREVADKRSIFVGNLGYDHPTKAEIKEFFGSCGEIERVTIRAKRYQVHAFVEFTTQEAVAEALKLDKKYLKDKPVTVRVTQSEAFSQKLESKTVLTVPSLPFRRFDPSVQITQITRKTGTITLDMGSKVGGSSASEGTDSETVTMAQGIRGVGGIEVTGAPTHTKQALNPSSYNFLRFSHTHKSSNCSIKVTSSSRNLQRQIFLKYFEATPGLASSCVREETMVIAVTFSRKKDMEIH